MTWTDNAACKGKPTAWWFPLQSDGVSFYARARAVCDGCPVRDECLALAFSYETNNERRHGMFGGLSPAERAAFADGRLPPRECRSCGTPFQSTDNRKVYCCRTCSQRESARRAYAVSADVRREKRRERYYRGVGA